MNELTLVRKSTLHGETMHLPASKSISNRVLILNALAGNKSTLKNLSLANDTLLMQRLINAQDEEINVEDAGTTMRFLTAYFAVTGQQKLMTGTARMKQRPIGILVDALRSIGVSLEYKEEEGYPPLMVRGFDNQLADRLAVRGDVSSQFISALMMIAPSLPLGLTMELTGKIGSRPYIEMTAALMRIFGVQVEVDDRSIALPAQSYQPTTYTVESDWSAASYWFSFAALADDASLTLPNLSGSSLQGDSAILPIMKQLGVTGVFQNDALILTKSSHQDKIEIDFTHCPDLAQTVAVVCAAKQIRGTFTGLESLRIKETDRIDALQQELGKIGADLIEKSDRWELIPSKALPEHVTIKTYHDHRMAMAFAPLATRMNVTIVDPGVVKKSYPQFWDDLKFFGFLTQS